MGRTLAWLGGGSPVAALLVTSTPPLLVVAVQASGRITWARVDLPVPMPTCRVHVGPPGAAATLVCAATVVRTSVLVVALSTGQLATVDLLSGRKWLSDSCESEVIFQKNGHFVAAAATLSSVGWQPADESVAVWWTVAQDGSLARGPPPAEPAAFLAAPSPSAVGPHHLVRACADDSTCFELVDVARQAPLLRYVTQQ